jgi:hypothetical protein
MIKYLLLFFIEAKRKYIGQLNSKDSPFGPAFATKSCKTYDRWQMTVLFLDKDVIKYVL